MWEDISHLTGPKVPETYSTPKRKKSFAAVSSSSKHLQRYQEFDKGLASLEFSPLIWLLLSFVVFFWINQSTSNVIKNIWRAGVIAQNDFRWSHFALGQNDFTWSCFVMAAQYKITSPEVHIKSFCTFLYLYPRAGRPLPVDTIECFLRGLGVGVGCSFVFRAAFGFGRSAFAVVSFSLGAGVGFWSPRLGCSACAVVSSVQIVGSRLVLV